MGSQPEKIGSPNSIFETSQGVDSIDNIISTGASKYNSFGWSPSNAHPCAKSIFLEVSSRIWV